MLTEHTRMLEAIEREFNRLCQEEPTTNEAIQQQLYELRSEIRELSERNRLLEAENQRFKFGGPETLYKPTESPAPLATEFPAASKPASTGHLPPYTGYDPETSEHEQLRGYQKPIHHVPPVPPSPKEPATPAWPQEPATPTWPQEPATPAWPQEPATPAWPQDQPGQSSSFGAGYLNEGSGTKKPENLESFLGLKLFNILGILLILIGAIATARFTYAYVPDFVKGIFIYVIGIIMLTGGEILSRRQANVFSLGLTAGGVALLYAATALSFFLLDIISMYPALVLIIITTAAAFVLSHWHNSQTIGVFALVGGYLPLFAISDWNTPYFAMVYFLILSTLALIIAIGKKWIAAQIIGFVLMMISTWYFAWEITWYTDAWLPSLVYSFIAFTIYQCLPIISAKTRDDSLSQRDITVLVFNMMFISATLFLILFFNGAWEFAGLLAIALTVLYLLTALLLQFLMPRETNCQVLYYITGLAYAVFVMPLQLDFAYFSLGWLIEGTLLLCYGLWVDQRRFTYPGLVITLLCFGHFLLFDLFAHSSMLYTRHLCLSLSSLLIFAVMLLKKRNTSSLYTFQLLLLINFWLFLLHSIADPLAGLLTNYPRDFTAYLLNALSITVTLLYALALTKIKALATEGAKVFSLVLQVLSIIGLLSLNFTNQVFEMGYSNSILVVAVFLLALVNILSVFAMRNLLTQLVKKDEIKDSWFPLLLSGFAVFLLTQNLVVTLRLNLSSLILTLIFALTALGWIIYGFMSRGQQMRVSGLALSFVTVIKFFLIDLGFLGEGMRIISYFLLGITLLIISFLYQYFNKRLEQEEKEADSP
jgi:uncharacterized membrane protein